MNSENDQAEIDARRDIADEDNERTFEEIMATAKFRWYGSFSVESLYDRRCVHGVIAVNADTIEAAIGVMYIKMSNDYPASEGWTAPHIIVDQDPVLFVPGVGNFIGEGSCPECGDPRGPCDDVEQCDNILTLEQEDLDPDFVEEIRREVRERADSVE